MAMYYSFLGFPPRLFSKSCLGLEKNTHGTSKGILNICVWILVLPSNTSHDTNIEWKSHMYEKDGGHRF